MRGASEQGREGNRPRGRQQREKNTSWETRKISVHMRPAQSGFGQIPAPLWASVSPSVSRGHPRSPPGEAQEDNGRGRARPAPSSGGPVDVGGRNFRAPASSSGNWGPAGRPAQAGRRCTAGRADRGRAGGSVRPRPGWAAAQAWQAQRKEGRILHLPQAPPGPSRRASGCGPAPLHAAPPPPRPGCGSSLGGGAGGSPGGRRHLEAAGDRSGGSRGSGTSGSLAPPRDQRRRRGAEKGAAPCWVEFFVTVPSRGGRSELGLGGRQVRWGTEVTSRNRRAICRKSKDEQRRVSTPPVCSFKWPRAGRVVGAEITVRSKLGKDPSPFVEIR